MCLTTLGQDNGTKIPIPSNVININEISNNADIDLCKNILGEPKKFDKKTYEFGPDGLEEGYTLSYDSLRITFIKYYGNIVMSNLSVIGIKYRIKISDFSFSIGDSLSILEPLLNSRFNCEEKIYNKEGDIIKFIFDVITIRSNYKCDGSMSIEIEKGKIKRLGIVFDEDLT